MSFESFFQGWLVRQEELLDELLSAPREGEEPKLRELIEKALTHYGAYYREKSLMASRDVLLVFSPRWFTSCERTFLWIAGWKPGMAFRLVRSNVEGLTDEQSEAIGRLREGTAAREEELAAEMTMVQEASVLGINLGPRYKH
ncbi:Transcription factor TGA5 [Acorus calamus]|uniref:Transcription factor TGA5 n=1 Tax=Acorus calamus TaxID=4465 RepID=A0AAV9DYQ4_ACOCL|nr:Transcription factor TGA5 [Acorus calamus]